MSDRLLIWLCSGASAAGASGALTAAAHGAIVVGVVAALLTAANAVGALLLARLVGAETREALT